MSCCHNYFVPTEGNENVFSVDIASITFGHGVLKETGEHALTLGMKRVALFTDKTLVSLPYVARRACACPERRIHGAACLGADTQGATNDDAGEIIAGQLIKMMKATGIPNGVGGVGYGKADVVDLTKGA